MDEKKKIEKKAVEKTKISMLKKLTAVKDELEKERNKAPAICPPPQPPTLVIQTPVPLPPIPTMNVQTVS